MTHIDKRLHQAEPVVATDLGSSNTPYYSRVYEMN